MGGGRTGEVAITPFDSLTHADIKRGGSVNAEIDTSLLKTNRRERHQQGAHKTSEELLPREKKT